MKKEIKIIFWGSDLFSISVLEEIIKNNLPISAVITIPDTPQGRSLKLTPPAIVDWSQEKGIKCYQISDFDSFNWNIFQPFENNLFIVASYGRRIPETILTKAGLGALNIHPSLLPKYRGPTPIQSAILNQETISGVTLMLLDEKIDHGPIIKQKEINIIDKSYEELISQMGKIGGRLILENLENYLNIVPRGKPFGKLPSARSGQGRTSHAVLDYISSLAQKYKNKVFVFYSLYVANKKISLQPQNHSLATYTKKITPADGYLNLESNYQELKSKILALHPKPGTFFIVNDDGKDVRIRINQAEIKDNQIIIKKITPAGKKEMSGKNFLNWLNNKKIDFKTASFVKFL